MRLCVFHKLLYSSFISTYAPVAPLSHSAALLHYTQSFFSSSLCTPYIANASIWQEVKNRPKRFGPHASTSRETK